MTKKLLITSLFLLVAFNTQSFARDDRPGWGRPGDGRPGDNRPGQGRPGDGRPGDGRPGDGRPGDGRPGDNRPGQGRPGDGRPGDNRPGNGRVVYQVVDTFQVQKLIERSNTTRVNLPNVRVIQLTALDNDVEIIEARVLLEDGREVFMDGLTGGLKENRSVAYTLDNNRGVRIRSITVRAVTRGLTGSRADLQITVGVLQ